MSLFSKSIASACAGLLLSASAVLAQTGGADVPGDAKGAGAMENGASSTGMKGGRMKAHHSMKKMKHHHMKKNRGKMAGHKTF